MIKNSILLLYFFSSVYTSAQIQVEKFDLTIETELTDTLQKVYGGFLNTEVEKVSIVKLKKKYDEHSYSHFLKHKKIYQTRKKWIERNSYEGSIIFEGDPYKFKHFDSIVFEYKYLGIEKKFIHSEIFLDEIEVQTLLKEIFDGTENETISMCYNPRHAIIFYNSEGKVSGIYEVCFECSNVKVGIVGTTMFHKSLPEFKKIVLKHYGKLK